METSSDVICFCRHVAMETERGLFMVNDLVHCFYMLLVILLKLFITWWVKSRRGIL